MTYPISAQLIERDKKVRNKKLLFESWKKWGMGQNKREQAISFSVRTLSITSISTLTRHHIWQRFHSPRSRPWQPFPGRPSSILKVWLNKTAVAKIFHILWSNWKIKHFYSKQPEIALVVYLVFSVIHLWKYFIHMHTQIQMSLWISILLSPKPWNEPRFIS